MRPRVRTRALSRSSRLSSIKRDKEGVASTVGTIMALLVFLAFMSLITTNYVPAWMMDNERQHMNQVIDQFGQMKGKVDSMIIEMEVKGTVATKMYAPIALGSSGVPLFATPTGGILDYMPLGGNTSAITLSYHPASDSNSIIPVQVGGGKIDLWVPNRYYIEQTVAYENGAIIISQSDGQTLRAHPSFEVDNITGSMTVSFTQIDILGTNQSLAGSDAIGLNIDLKYIDGQTYQLSSGVLEMSLTTTFEKAWMDYFNMTMEGSGLVNGTDYALTSVPSTEKNTHLVKLVLYDVSVVNYNRALVLMSTLA